MKKSLMVLLLLLSCLFVSVQGEPPYPAYRITLVTPWTQPPPSEDPRNSSGFELTSINNSGRIVGTTYRRAQQDRRYDAFVWQAGVSNLIGISEYQFGGPSSPKVTINNSGHIVWTTPPVPFSSDHALATVIIGGQVKTLLSDTNLPGSDVHFGGWLGGVAMDISDSGFVVGQQAYMMDLIAFVWKPGEYVKRITASPLGFLGRANAVNNHGWYVGYELFGGESPSRAHFGKGNTWTNLNSLIATNSGWVLTNAFDINDNGQIVGVGITNGQSQAFLWEGGEVIGLGDLGTNGSAAAAINLLGQVVGTSNGRPFVWENGVMTDLNTLIPEDSGWVLTSAVDINNHGEIIGMGNLGGYVLRPVSVMCFYPAPENEGGTNLTFTLDAHPGVTYVLESSTNFTSWSPLLTNVTTSITNMVTIPEDSTTGAKYFRATLQP